MTTTTPTTLEPSVRATPLAPDDRRSMIVDAVLPLLLEHGRAVTSRQLAEAAGVAEGTIFRAFGDKDSLLKAAVARYLDPEPLLTELAAIDPAEPLDAKMRSILGALRRRFDGVFRVMSTLNEEDRPTPASVREDIERLVAAALAPEAKALRWSPAQVAQFTRLLAFSSSFPLLTSGSEFTDAELAEFILHGIVGPSVSPKDTHAR
ncbi:TetR/AcrR family transcriptional regulator [Mycetocola sp. 2940]|uniref:TetR/AcrR family transcriptional regulator n=1 Tax=Mycetocola sp. 2940 TaxID=3156452 RepID=UPI003393F798